VVPSVYESVCGSTAATHEKHGVLAFEAQPDAIDVEFTSGWVYRFSYEKTGALRVERMKQLAESGHGLSTVHQQAREESATSSGGRKES
jgi:hypothetical protein